MVDNPGIRCRGGINVLDDTVIVPLINRLPTRKSRRNE